MLPERCPRHSVRKRRLFFPGSESVTKNIETRAVLKNEKKVCQLRYARHVHKSAVRLIIFLIAQERIGRRRETDFLCNKFIAEIMSQDRYGCAIDFCAWLTMSFRHQIAHLA